jgi:hypothetical protein
MKTASSHYRKAKQFAVAAERTQKMRELVFASDNFTEADRKVAETFEASELLAEFMAEMAA